MTPFSSVAMLEKFALLKIASCNAPVFSSASWRRTSVKVCTATPAGPPASSALPALSLVAIALFISILCPGSLARVPLNTLDQLMHCHWLCQKGKAANASCHCFDFFLCDASREKDDRHRFKKRRRRHARRQMPPVHGR